MSENTAPKVDSVSCGYCDVEAVKGMFGGRECPDCGRSIKMMISYSNRSEEQRQNAIERHNE